jgi:hypothetical protein
MPRKIKMEDIEFESSHSSKMSDVSDKIPQN